MKAILLRQPGGPEALEYVDLPTPDVPPGHARVKAAAIGVGRPDVMIRTGKYKWMPPLPAVPGNELAGHVVEVGAGVDSALRGRSVLVSARELETRGGCYANEVVVPAGALILLADGIDFDDAVALPNYQLAWGLLHDATRGRLPKRIYLNGAAGGVGSAVIQLCMQLGIEAVAGAGTDEKRRFALSLGAVAAIDTQPAVHDQTAPGAIADRVLDATGGRGVDVAFDHLCGPHVAEHLRMLSPFGLLVSYNALRGMPKQDVFAALRAEAAHALGIVTYNMHAYDADRAGRRALMTTPMQWLAEGRLRPAIAERLPLAQAREAHERMDARSVVGKLVLKPTS